MAKNDFHYIAFKILVYYYACLKGEAVFNEKMLHKAVGENISESYIYHVLRALSEDGMMDGLVFAHAWGNEYFPANSLAEGIITAKGAEYLRENSMMQKALEVAKETKDIIVTLLPLVF